MAKSLRSNGRQRNNTVLKRYVYGPVESARAARLSAKLMEIASEPKPTKDAEMKTDDADSDGTLSPGLAPFRSAA